jgi:hypothetical protein
MKRSVLAALAVLSLAGSASARAEVLLTGFGGVAFAGATERSRGTWGGSIGFLGSVVGFEAEFATTPDFFGSSSDSGAFTDNDVVTLMGNFIVATPGHLRLYAFFGEHFGLRGDVRYFRDLQDADPDGNFDFDFGNVDYWRAVGGITIKF